MIAGGAFAVGHVPYSRPETKSFFGIRSAYAQPSVVYTISCSLEPSLPVPPVMGQACQNAILQNIVATVSPIPPVGTMLRCSPTTDDPVNMGLLPDDFLPTNGAGQVMFFPFNLVTNVPTPPLQVGSILTMTVTFNDPASFGMASCSTPITITPAC
jgi:hypothetical protein